MRCLLLHGLGGGPFELESVAAAIEAAGHEAACPALPGHGGGEQAYLASCWPQWKDFALAAYRSLASRGPVMLLGYSLGGMLALEIAQSGERPPAGLCCLATPLWLRSFWPPGAADWRLFLLPWLEKFLNHARLPPRGRASREIAPWAGHNVMSTRHLAAMHRALAATRKGLWRVRSPLCVISLEHDPVCPPWQSAWLARKCQSPHAELHVLRVPERRAGHLPAAHRQAREAVARLCTDFANFCQQAQ